MRVRVFIAIISSIVVSSCTTQLETYVAHPPTKGWASGHEVVVEVENCDTTSRSELSVFVRYRNPLQRDTLRLEITTLAPDSTSYSEPLTISPPYPNTQRTKLCEVVYRTNVVWRQTGEYRVIFAPQHGIEGVEAIGVRKKMYNF